MKSYPKQSYCKLEIVIYLYVCWLFILALDWRRACKSLVYECCSYLNTFSDKVVAAIYLSCNTVPLNIIKMFILNNLIN